ncbi:MAG: DinB family protein [Chloroflexi bacterium]|nr:DinB family protein [Chloroflexota bacterium]
MSDEFDRDLAAARDGLASAREGLLAVVSALAEDDLTRARRGGWSVRKVLEHVIQSEWLYSRLATHLKGSTSAEEPEPAAFASVAEAAEQLDAVRAALLAAIDGVDEESFYRLQTVGHEEYSVLSLLENVALHDREHAPQVQEILAAS